MEKCDKCVMKKIDFQTLKAICRRNMKQFDKPEDEGCEHFESRYIEYPLTIQGIQNNFTKESMRSLYDCGTLVKINPCGKEYGNKTYLGILLGDLIIGAFTSFHQDDQKLHVNPYSNPAIFVPELKKIIYGCESWWSEIKNSEDFKDITSEDINNVWYVQLLKAMIENEDEPPECK